MTSGTTAVSLTSLLVTATLFRSEPTQNFRDASREAIFFPSPSTSNFLNASVRAIPTCREVHTGNKEQA